jgi:hypothetical protein
MALRVPLTQPRADVGLTVVALATIALSALSRALISAASHACLDLYRRAGTVADTAGVDHTVLDPHEIWRPVARACRSIRPFTLVPASPRPY